MSKTNYGRSPIINTNFSAAFNLDVKNSLNQKPNPILRIKGGKFGNLATSTTAATTATNKFKVKVDHDQVISHN